MLANAILQGWQSQITYKVRAKNKEQNEILTNLKPAPINNCLCKGGQAQLLLLAMDGKYMRLDLTENAKQEIKSKRLSWTCYKG